MSAERRLPVGVPADLLTLRARSGHGRVWSRTLDELEKIARLLPIDSGSGRTRRRLGRAPRVVLADGHAALPDADAPIVVQVHEAGWFDPALRDLLDPEFYAEISKRTEAAIRRAARVITPSEAARREIVVAYGLDPALVHAVPHGVDGVFNPGATGGRRLIANARGGTEAQYVLFAAMLHPRKNVAAVRDAMTALAAEGFPHLLAIAGGPATDRPNSSALEEAACAELPGAPGRIVRIDRPSDPELAGLMAEAEAFCLPSLYEGFGLTALEAMACGTPVVVSDRGALPEIAGDAGIVAEASGTAVAAALRSLLTDPERARRLGEAAAERARGFTWERTAAGWLKVLRLAAAGRAG